MILTSAIRILETLAKNARDNATKDALRLAIEALRRDPAATAQAVLTASGKTDVTMALLRSDEGDHWVAWLHNGPMVSSRSLSEALEGLLKKVAKK